VAYHWQTGRRNEGVTRGGLDWDLRIRSWAYNFSLSPLHEHSGAAIWGIGSAECSWSGERGEIVCSDEIVTGDLGEKSSAGGGMASTAENMLWVEGYRKLKLNRELTFLSLNVLLPSPYFICLLGCLFGLPFQFNAIAVNLFVKKRHSDDSFSN